MSNKKQTAVDWYAEQEIELTLDFISKKNNDFEYGIKKLRLIEQAKEMDRNNIINAAARGYLAMPERFILEDAKEYGTAYYENTFNIDKENKG
jgi:hypothetical protein